MTNYTFRSNKGKFITHISSSVSGSYSFSVLNPVKTTILFVGGGAGAGVFDARYYGGWSNWRCSCGGSGALYKGIIELPQGDYTVTVGSGGGNINGTGAGQRSGNGGDTLLTNSNDEILISAGGGQGSGNIYYEGDSVKGAGGEVVLNITPVETIQSQNGANGKGTTGWQYNVSPYDNTETGYGASGSAYANGNDGNSLGYTGIGGYINIVFENIGDTSDVQIVSSSSLTTLSYFSKYVLKNNNKTYTFRRNNNG